MILNGDHPVTTARRNSKPPRWLIALTLALCASVNANAQTGAAVCGGLTNGFGPFDYRQHAGSTDYLKNSNNPLRLVEHGHFRPAAQNLIHGAQGVKSAVGPELDYTLRAFPNHHKALDAMVRLSRKEGKDPTRNTRYPVECYFDRAIRFQPEDTIVRMIYATYLGQKNRLSDALEQLKFAARAAKDNPFTHYNLGLIYFDLKQFDLALEQARIAYGMGMQRPELREKLSSGGHWTESPAVPATAGPASATAATQ